MNVENRQLCMKHYLAIVFVLIEGLSLEPQHFVFRYLQYNHLFTIMKNSPKLAILQSLDVMDQVQMETVLIYIKSLLHLPEQKDKKEAMREIRQALRQYKRSRNLQLMA